MKCECILFYKDRHFSFIHRKLKFESDDLINFIRGSNEAVASLWVDILKWISQQLGFYAEVVDEIECYLRNNDASTHDSCNANRPISNDYSKVCEYLSENLRSRWIDLGRALGLNSRVNELASDNSKPLKNRIIMFLEEFGQLTGDDAMAILLEALKKCELNRQRDYIVKSLLH